MRDALCAVDAARSRLARGYLLMLDFDGVLAPIVADPERARMHARTKRLLAACAQHAQVVVISGRALADVKMRVSVPGLWYAGNHGNEWHFGIVRGCAAQSHAARGALRAARAACFLLAKRYSGVTVEDKALTFSVHYRRLAQRRIAAFCHDMHALQQQFARALDVTEGGEYIFDMRPRSARTKGDAVRLARTCARPGLLPIFIGDDATDEDAFNVLPRGITIRVGATRASAARYYVRARADVDPILETLARLAPTPRSYPRPRLPR